MNGWVLGRKSLPGNQSPTGLKNWAFSEMGNRAVNQTALGFSLKSGGALMSSAGMQASAAGYGAPAARGLKGIPLAHR